MPKERKGLVLPKTAPKFQPQEFRWTFPGDLAEAIKLAAKNNAVDAVEVARHLLGKALKVELAEIRKGKRSEE